MIYDIPFKITDFINIVNNAWLRYWNVEDPLTIEIISPNSRYRENTQVLTSFMVHNAAPFDFIPSNNATVNMSVYNGSTLLYKDTQTEVVIPANGENLVYFKWTVPSGLNNAYLTIRCEVIDNGSVVDKRAIGVRSEKQSISQTPETNYEEKKPTNWSSSTLPTNHSTIATWSEWIYTDGTFTKKTYGIGLSSTSLISITPDSDSPSANYSILGSSIKSGYGFSLYYYPIKVSLSGTTYPTSSAYTPIQSAYATFPEFAYSTVLSKYRTLDLAGSTFRFCKNSKEENERLHFIPIWYPNGTNNYAISCYAYDFWTPAGMISAQVNSNSFDIKGSAYDDWFIGK